MLCCIVFIVMAAMKIVMVLRFCSLGGQDLLDLMPYWLAGVFLYCFGGGVANKNVGSVLGVLFCSSQSVFR